MDEITTTKAVQLADLSPAHQAFITAILQYKNPTRAYMSAYPDCTFNAATVCAHRLLTDVRIQAVIASMLDARAMQAGEVIDRQGALARVSISDVIEMVDEPAIDRHGEALERGGRQVYRQVPHLREGALEQYGYAIKSIRPANGGGVAVEMLSVQDALSAMERIRRLIQDTPTAINVEQVVIYMPDNQRDAPKIVDAQVRSLPDAPSGPDVEDPGIDDHQDTDIQS